MQAEKLLFFFDKHHNENDNWIHAWSKYKIRKKSTINKDVGDFFTKYK